MPARAPSKLLRLLRSLLLTCTNADNTIRWQPGERLDHLFEQRCDAFVARGDDGHLAVVTDNGGITFDERFFPEGDAWRGRRTHQVRLQGGDASSDSYCYP